MRRTIIMLIFTTLGLSSCLKQEVVTSTFIEETEAPGTSLINSGEFKPTIGIMVAGVAQVRKENNLYSVNLVNFSISSGPDLKVYISKDSVPSDFVNLGDYRIDINHYPIPVNINYIEYPYVLIHCQMHNHLYAKANLHH